MWRSCVCIKIYFGQSTSVSVSFTTGLVIKCFPPLQTDSSWATLDITIWCSSSQFFFMAADHLEFLISCGSLSTYPSGFHAVWKPVKIQITPPRAFDCADLSCQCPGLCIVTSVPAMSCCNRVLVPRLDAQFDMLWSVKSSNTELAHCS